MAADRPTPWFEVYQAGVLSTTCYRMVKSNPPQPSDFLSHADLGYNVAWFKMILALGLSAWEDRETCIAVGRGRYPYISKIELALVGPELPWARTVNPGHVTFWADSAIALKGIVAVDDV